MYENNIFDRTMAEEYDATTLRGLIGGMIDDEILCFEHRGLKVSMGDRGSIHVTDAETGRMLGGQLKVVGAPIEEVRQWIEAKADLYGDD